MVDMGIDASQFTWQRSAACNGLPSYLFYPEERTLPGFKEHPDFEGKSYEDFCRGCPVKYLCLDFALMHDMQGVWGGTTDKQRDERFCIDERWEMRAFKEEMGQYKALYGHS